MAWPGAWYIAGSIVFGIIGYLSFRRGRKTEQSQLTWVGMALMLYPYAVSETWMLWALGAAMSIWVALKWNPPS